MSDLVARLRDIVGAANVVTGDAAVDFTHDATFLEHDLLAVVRPAGTEEVAAVVRACAETRTPVVARGGGTSLVGGSVPPGGGIRLSPEPVDGIQVHPPNP